MVERRMFTRIVFETKAIVESGSASLNGEVLNLGLGGMLFSTPGADSLQDNQDIVTWITIEGKGSILNIRLRGKVLRRKDKKVAIRFDLTKIELDSLLLLKTVILTNGGDQEKIEREFNAILKKEEERLVHPFQASP